MSSDEAGSLASAAPEELPSNPEDEVIEEQEELGSDVDDLFGDGDDDEVAEDAPLT